MQLPVNFQKAGQSASDVGTGDVEAFRNVWDYEGLRFSLNKMEITFVVLI